MSATGAGTEVRSTAGAARAKAGAAAAKAETAAEPPTLPAPQRILDAAEAIFASRGYHGATIRDITDAAGVPLSLARYHFGAKDQLYREVLARRAEETCSQLEASLRNALAAANAENRLEAIVDAMVSLSVERLESGDSGWHNYLQLLSQLGQLADRPDLLRPFRDRYRRTISRYSAALEEALPQADEATVEWGLHFLQILVGHAILDLAVAGLLEGRKPKTPDWRALRRHLVTHVVGGIEAQMALGGGEAAMTAAGARVAAKRRPKETPGRSKVL